MQIYDYIKAFRFVSFGSGRSMCTGTFPVAIVCEGRNGLS